MVIFWWDGNPFYGWVTLSPAPGNVFLGVGQPPTPWKSILGGGVDLPLQMYFQGRVIKGCPAPLPAVEKGIFSYEN